MHGREMARRLSLDSRLPSAQQSCLRQRPTVLVLPDWAREQKAAYAKREASKATSVSTTDTVDVMVDSPAKSPISPIAEGVQLHLIVQRAPVNDKKTDRHSKSDTNLTVNPYFIGLLYRSNSTSSEESIRQVSQPESPAKAIWKKFSHSESWRRLSLNERRTRHRTNEDMGGSATDINSSSRGSPATPTQDNRENHDKNANSAAARPTHQRRLSFKRNSARPSDGSAAEEQLKRETLPRQWIAPKGMLNDAVYEGECTSVPDGAGILLTPSFAYMGEWENGTQHGYGVYICLVSRCRYEGQFYRGAAADYGRLLLLNAGPTYVYGRFSRGKFIQRPSYALQDRNEAIQAAAKARSAAETALARACPATQGTFRQLTHEMAEWARVGHAPSIARHDADTLPLVYPGPLTQMVSLRLSVAQLEVHSPKTTLPQAIAT